MTTTNRTFPWSSVTQIACINILHTPCLFTFQLLIVIEVIYNTCTIKPAQAVTFFLSCHRKFHMNSTSFKRSNVLVDHFFFVPMVTS